MAAAAEATKPLDRRVYSSECSRYKVFASVAESNDPLIFVESATEAIESLESIIRALNSAIGRAAFPAELRSLGLPADHE